MKKVLFTVGTVLLTILVVLSFLAYKGYVWLNTPNLKDYPVRGIDVSHHQKSIDWENVADQGIAFAYIKATEGRDFKDSRFLFNNLLHGRNTA